MTANERMYVSGLVDTYVKSTIKDHKLAGTILEALKVDSSSIDKILK